MPPTLRNCVDIGTVVVVHTPQYSKSSTFLRQCLQLFHYKLCLICVDFTLRQRGHGPSMNIVGPNVMESYCVCSMHMDLFGL